VLLVPRLSADAEAAGFVCSAAFARRNERRRAIAKGAEPRRSPVSSALLSRGANNERVTSVWPAGRRDQASSRTVLAWLANERPTFWSEPIAEHARNYGSFGTMQQIKGAINGGPA
jgi:hypothetical protein